jgi:hypothetical protein
MSCWAESVNYVQTAMAAGQLFLFLALLRGSYILLIHFAQLVVGVGWLRIPIRQWAHVSFNLFATAEARPCIMPPVDHYTPGTVALLYGV